MLAQGRIARAFGLEERRPRARLRGMLRELADEGQIEPPAQDCTIKASASVVLCDITGRDNDGELIATPAEWDSEEHGPAPKKSASTSRAKRRRGKFTASAITHSSKSTRAATRASTSTTAAASPRSSTAHAIARRLYRARQTVADTSTGRQEKPGRELAIPQGATLDAQDGDLIAAEVARSGRYGLPTARVTERLGSLKSERAVSLIAINAHGIPSGCGREVIAEAEKARPATLPATARTGAMYRLSPSIRSMRKITTTRCLRSGDPDPGNRGGFILDVAIADVAHYVRPALRSTAKRWPAGTRRIFRTASCRCCWSGFPTISCSLKPREDRAALAVRMVIGADGRKQPQVSPHPDAVGSETALRAGTGRNRRPSR